MAFVLTTPCVSDIRTVTLSSQHVTSKRACSRMRELSTNRMTYARTLRRIVPGPAATATHFKRTTTCLSNDGDRAETVENVEESPASDQGSNKSSKSTSFKSSSSRRQHQNENELHESWRIYSSGGNKCVICSGKGVTRCLFCYGETTIKIGPDIKRDTIQCPQCAGKGHELCRRCDGSGIRPATRFDVNLWKEVPNVTNEDICNGPTYEEAQRLRQDSQQNADSRNAEDPSDVLQHDNVPAVDESSVPPT